MVGDVECSTHVDGNHHRLLGRSLLVEAVGHCLSDALKRCGGRMHALIAMLMRYIRYIGCYFRENYPLHKFSYIRQ